jgi:hypothetical protein
LRRRDVHPPLRFRETLQFRLRLFERHLLHGTLQLTPAPSARRSTRGWRGALFEPPQPPSVNADACLEARLHEHASEALNAPSAVIRRGAQALDRVRAGSGCRARMHAQQGRLLRRELGHSHALFPESARPLDVVGGVGGGRLTPARVRRKVLARAPRRHGVGY